MGAPAYKYVKTEKLGVGGSTPVGPRPAIPVPTGGTGAAIDAQARTAINSLIAVLVAYGLIEAS